jgi:hypothetical protein
MSRSPIRNGKRVAKKEIANPKFFSPDFLPDGPDNVEDNEPTIFLGGISVSDDETGNTNGGRKKKHKQKGGHGDAMRKLEDSNRSKRRETSPSRPMDEVELEYGASRPRPEGISTSISMSLARMHKQEEKAIRKAEKKAEKKAEQKAKKAQRREERRARREADEVASDAASEASSQSTTTTTTSNAPAQNNPMQTPGASGSGSQNVPAVNPNTVATTQGQTTQPAQPPAPVVQPICKSTGAVLLLLRSHSLQQVNRCSLPLP